MRLNLVSSFLISSIVLILNSIPSLVLGGELRLSPEGAELGAAWQFSNGAEFPGAQGSLSADAQGALRLKYDFSGGGNYVAAYYHFAQPAALEAVAFRIKKPAGMKITVRASDSRNQTFQKSVLFDGEDWQPLEFDLERWDSHWGGPNDGALWQPIKSIGILFERTAAPGAVAIADVVARTGSLEELRRRAPSNARGEYRVTDFGDEAGFRPDRGVLKNSVWNVDFSKTDWSSLHHSLSLFGEPRELKLMVRGGAKGNVLKLVLGSHFQGFTRALGTLNGGEQTFSVPAPPEGWTHAGAQEKRVAYPLRVSRLVFERGAGPRQTTVLELKELRCATDVARDKAVTLLAQLEEAGVQDGKRLLNVSVTGWNLLDEAVNAPLEIRAQDWEERELFTKRDSWALAPGGAPHVSRQTIAVPATLNYAGVEWRLGAPDRRPRATAFAAYARALDDAGDPAPRPESPWGMGVYLYRYPNNAEGLARMERAAALAQAAGVKWSREEFSWGRIEPRRDEFHFEHYDKIVATARRHGISVYGLLSYWSPYTKAYTEEGIDDFCRWARAVVRRYKDRIRHWEIYNEPNIFFWSGPRELYPVLVKKCLAAIKEEDPEARVLAISTSGIDREFIQFCLDRDAPFDVLTIHPYRQALGEIGFMNELREVARQVDGRPVWITEMGWSTQVGGADEREQARMLTRSYLAAVASGVCQNVSWYNFRNDGDDPFYNEHNFGVLREDLTPKPAYRALATVCRTLSRGRPRARTDFGDKVFALEMGEGLALWTAAPELRLGVREESGKARVLNLMGEELAPPRAAGVLTLTLRKHNPLFLSGARIVPTEQPVAPAAQAVPAVIRF